jgi:hypothetical protein
MKVRIRKVDRQRPTLTVSKVRLLAGHSTDITQTSSKNKVTLLLPRKNS